jgi:hypothetical protein
MPRRRIKAINNETDQEYVTDWTDSYEHALNEKEAAQKIGGDSFRYIIEEDINFDGVPDTDLEIVATDSNP